MGIDTGSYRNDGVPGIPIGNFSRETGVALPPREQAALPRRHPSERGRRPELHGTHLRAALRGPRPRRLAGSRARQRSPRTAGAGDLVGDPLRAASVAPAQPGGRELRAVERRGGAHRSRRPWSAAACRRRTSTATATSTWWSSRTVARRGSSATIARDRRGVRVRLVGKGMNREAIGALVELKSDGRVQQRLVKTGFLLSLPVGAGSDLRDRRGEDRVPARPLAGWPLERTRGAGGAGVGAARHRTALSAHSSAVS